MIFYNILIVLGIIIFEISFRQISIFAQIYLYFIIVSCLYWVSRYKESILIGILAGFFIDLAMGEKLGRHIIAIFIPLLFFTFIDRILQIESRLSRIIYSILTLVFATIIYSVIFNLIFNQFIPDFKNISLSIIISTVICGIILFIFINLFLKEEKSVRLTRSKNGLKI